MNRREALSLSIGALGCSALGIKSEAFAASGGFAPVVQLRTKIGNQVFISSASEKNGRIYVSIRTAAGKKLGVFSADYAWAADENIQSIEVRTKQGKRFQVKEIDGEMTTNVPDVTVETVSAARKGKKKKVRLGDDAFGALAALFLFAVTLLGVSLVGVGGAVLGLSLGLVLIKVSHDNLEKDRRDANSGLKHEPGMTEIPGVWY